MANGQSIVAVLTELGYHYWIDSSISAAVQSRTDKDEDIPIVFASPR
jgi:hypothetical protein